MKTQRVWILMIKVYKKIIMFSIMSFMEYWYSLQLQFWLLGYIRESAQFRGKSGICNGRKLVLCKSWNGVSNHCRWACRLRPVWANFSWRVPEPGSDAIDCQPGGRLNIAPIFLQMEYERHLSYKKYDYVDNNYYI